MKAILLSALLLCGCAARQGRPAAGAVPPLSTPAWIDLAPGTQLRIDQAYFRPGSTEKNLANYLGTETARYRVTNRSQLQFLSLQPLNPRPSQQTLVERLLDDRQMRYRQQRFFFAVKFARRGTPQGAVLLGAASRKELLRLSERLANAPDEICGTSSIHCVVFPEMCTVSPEIEIAVNGEERVVVWGTTAAAVAKGAAGLVVERPEAGTWITKVDPADLTGTRLTLRARDRIRFEPN